jgi:3-deoxy-D-manno-octulosonate 8-phosphate phosphatase (KDO 8-P phosphatase)
MALLKEELKSIKGFVFDMDGVLSSTVQQLTLDGETARTVNVKDGFALMAAIRKGYSIGVITGGNTIDVINRCKKLGIKNLYTGTFDKLPCFYDFLEKNNLSADEIIYAGDDLPDYPPMRKAGIPVCPNDAAPEIKAISKYISDRNGGDGCIRDIIEQVMRVQGTWIDPEALDWGSFEPFAKVRRIKGFRS